MSHTNRSGKSKREKSVESDAESVVESVAESAAGSISSVVSHESNVSDTATATATPLSAIKGIDMPLAELLDVCRYITEAADKHKNGNYKVTTAYPGVKDLTKVSKEVLDRSFKNAFKVACRSDSVKLKSMAQVTHSFLDGPEYVNIFPDFPKSPVGVFKIFMELAGYREYFKSVPADLREQFNDNSNSVKKDAIKKHEEQVVEYNEALDRFVTDHPELNDSQKRHVISRKIVIKGQPKKGIKRSKLSAFDYFKTTKKGKYADLNDFEREKKLQSTFDRLKEKEKQIFLDLEANQ
uniref:HMG box domain-containing protein n=1 Tax=Rhabditophanes sp. KR3021 TaxID=114890 RepID=A0AC35TXY9_9BILA